MSDGFRNADIIQSAAFVGHRFGGINDEDGTSNGENMEKLAILHCLVVKGKAM